MKKKIRKSIRLGGRLITETFASKEAAEIWYSSKFNEKKLDAHAVAKIVKGGVLTKTYWEKTFFPQRQKSHPASTWKADEQRFEKYIRPAIGNTALNQVSSTMVRAYLSKMTRAGLSPKTRDRVRALTSAIFNSAINAQPPLAKNNPTFGLEFDEGARKGVKLPSHLRTTRECMAYLKAAQQISLNHYVIGLLGLGAGLRKQEMIALRWIRVDLESAFIEVAEKFIQASGEIVSGTKAGSEQTRFVPIGPELVSALMDLFATTRHKKDSDFVLAHPDGKPFGPREVSRMHAQTCERASLKVTVHGLRHSYGREFAQRSGNMGALKDILGHSSLAVTEQYSTLGKERLNDFKNVISYGTLKGTETTGDNS